MVGSQGRIDEPSPKLETTVGSDTKGWSSKTPLCPKTADGKPQNCSCPWDSDVRSRFEPVKRRPTALDPLAVYVEYHSTETEIVRALWTELE